MHNSSYLEVYRPQFEVYNRTGCKALNKPHPFGGWSVKRLNSPYLEVNRPQFEVCNRILQHSNEFSVCKIQYRPQTMVCNPILQTYISLDKSTNIYIYCWYLRSTNRGNVKRYIALQGTLYVLARFVEVFQSF